MRYIDPDGMEVGDPLVKMMVRRNSASNLFGNVRINKDGTSRVHQGIDYYAKSGTPTLAVKNGVVYSVTKSEDYGLQLIIEVKGDDKKTYFATYDHLSKVMVNAKDKVKENTVVALTGTSGNAEGMEGEDQHLHFELRTIPNPGKGLSGRENPNNIVDTKFESENPLRIPQSSVRAKKKEDEQKK